MSDFSKALDVSSSGLRAQARRLRHLSETAFSAGDGVATVAPGRVRLDRSELEKIHDPSHPLADDAGNYDGSNVNLLIELADAREAQRSYEANLKMFEQTRKMSTGLLELLRR
jgi:flagellar basal-body rod protein FlgC